VVVLTLVGMVKGLTFLKHLIQLDKHHITFFGMMKRLELNRVLLTAWEERCCNNVKYVKNNVFLNIKT